MTDILDPEIAVVPTTPEGYSFPSDYASLCGMWLLDSSDNIIREILPRPAWMQDIPLSPGEPLYYSPKGDGSFILTPPADTTKGYSAKVLYYSDLTSLALDSVVMDKILRKWRTLFIQGIFAKALQSKNDTRADKEILQYQAYLKLTVSREKYQSEFEGNVPLQCKVVDY